MHFVVPSSGTRPWPLSSPTGLNTFPSQTVIEHAFGWVVDWCMSPLLDYKLLKGRDLTCLHSWAPLAQCSAKHTASVQYTFAGHLAECMLLADSEV